MYGNILSLTKKKKLKALLVSREKITDIDKLIVLLTDSVKYITDQAKKFNITVQSNLLIIIFKDQKK